VAELDVAPDVVAHGPVTPSEKVALFRRLFRGREDVFPRLWINQKAGKKGYAPVCANDFVKGICEKPAVKCGACPNRAFEPVTDRVVTDHLLGRHVMGTYAMLADETCWFLAADFDDATWQEDVLAFARVGRELGIDVAVERSRSGEGAHAWLFFAEPVPAVTARKLGTLLITRASMQRPRLSLQSYDRLFPSQDTMPKGGFGNLIALPLQQEPKQAGNSVFVDDDLQPHLRQWAYLASVRRIPRPVLEGIVGKAERSDGVLGLPLWAAEAEAEDAKPWQRPPSGSIAAPIPGPLPAELTVVLSQRLFLATDGLPPALLDRIRRLAAFANPEFHRNQAMRRPVYQTPRVIDCATYDGGYLSLPRGCLHDLTQLTGSLGIVLTVTDERCAGEPLDLTFRGELTADQSRAVDALATHEFGVLEAPPGSGKTVMAAALIAMRGCSTLVLVHRQQLVAQWRARLAAFLGLAEADIGYVAGGKRKANGRLDVAMLQSLVHGDVVDDLVAGYGHVVVDESHHVAAVTFERVLNAVRARFVTGLTATPQRREGWQPIAHMQLGPVRHILALPEVPAGEATARRVIVRRTALVPEALPRDASISEVQSALARDEARNLMIAGDVLKCLAEGRRVLVLSERVEHLGWFQGHLAEHAVALVVMHGGLTPKERRLALVEWQGKASPAVLLATGRLVGEGFDDPLLDTLCLAAPVSWKGTLVQYAGRLTRESPGKRELLVYDYLDDEVGVLRRMFTKRQAGYRALGFGVDGVDAAWRGERFEGRARGGLLF
jgi:superfamily II DNA or RNA helicase